MSCNGCRILRKGCSESCLLRPCIQWIESPEAQGHATVFVAKFFGRAGLMSFISNVPESQRPGLFQSLLYEACGRTVNPVSGAVGLLWTGNWHVCQAAVETVLRGGTVQPIPEFLNGIPMQPEADEASEVACRNMWKLQDLNNCSNLPKRKRIEDQKSPKAQSAHLDLSLTPPHSAAAEKQQRPTTPSLNSEESVTTISFESGGSVADDPHLPKLLNLFV
ncbi:hypothetical protein Nepgr_016671 [Nepenthes gracilis]|uniref:LOB domain-containing protein n=1 Tax=Nepenthes gracilis TaxID=150966 RepID=A0AAD3SQ54_NEPGR|nr:hypothetical protein Nepgr_016671 [Nepenthes gracilis]